MTSPDEMLWQVRSCTEASETMLELCEQQSLSLEEIDVNILCWLTSRNLVKIVVAPMAPITGTGKVQTQKRCVLTEVGQDLCSVMLNH